MTNKISTGSFKRYTNHEHYGYQQSMMACVLKSGLSLEELNLSRDQVDEWQMYVGLEADSNDRVKSEADTILLGKMETERDWCIKKFFSGIRFALKSPYEAERTAGISLKPVLTTYRDILKNGLYATTERVTGMICDLGKEREAGAVRSLKLEDLVEQLRANNNAINEKLHERSQYRTDVLLPKSEMIRKATDKCWERVVDHIQATLLFCTDSETKAKIEALIKLINTKVAEYQKLYNMRKGRGKGKGEPTVSSPGTLTPASGGSEGGDTGASSPGGGVWDGISG